MEEERLLLLKENKEIKDKAKTLTYENDDFKARIAEFESELDELKD